MISIKSFSPKDVQGKIKHDRIEMNCQDENATMFISHRKNTPLLKYEMCAELRIVGDESDFSIQLDSVDLDKLEEAVHQAQKELVK